MTRLKTVTQMRKTCGLITTQDHEFDQWFDGHAFRSVLNLSEYGDWDTVGQHQRLWDRYAKGHAPWDLIMYFNNTRLVELKALCDRLDELRSSLTADGQIYLALNKWCVTVDQIDPALCDLDFDSALPIYIGKNLHDFSISQYRYISDDRGDLHNWVHGNNRFWLTKK